MRHPEPHEAAHVRISTSHVAVPTLQAMTRCEVTLLFSDLFGYSTLTEECEVTEVAAVVAFLKQGAARIVRDHGGLINQFVGDEIVAIFGFPQRSEDHARRAGCAAIELHAFVRSAQVAQLIGGERAFALHSGIDSGVLLIDSRDVRDGLFSLTGTAMNRAARLRSLAGRDEILVSDRAHRALNRFFVTEARGAQHLKGIAEAVVPYRLVARREPTLIAAPAQSARARRELVVLFEAWNQTAQHGGRIVEITGASGSGKSRLLEAFLSRFQSDPARVLAVECRAADHTPLSAVTRLLDDLLQRICRSGTAQPERCEAGASQLPSHVAVVSPTIAALVSEAPQRLAAQDAHTVFVPSLIQFFVKYLDAVGPSVIAIDDAHWLDAGSRAVLAALAVGLARGGHLLVYTARDESEHRVALAQLRAALPEEPHTRIALGPLSLDELNDLVADYLAIPETVDTELVRQLALLSDGTPLGALEFLRVALEQGYLQQHDQRWRFEPAWRSMILPRSSQELIQLRLSSLQPQHLAVLRAAAALGTPVRRETLIAADRGTGASIDAALWSALEARLLQRNEHGQYAFVHDSVREALLRDLSNAQLRMLHGEIAQALHANGVEGADALYLVARLYATCDLSCDPARAFGVLRRASRQAIQDCDDKLALSFLKPAHSAAELAGIVLERDLYVDLAETSLRTGDIHASLRYFEVALARSYTGVERAHVFGRIAWIHHFESDSAACWNALSAALAECGSSADDLETLCWLNIAYFRAALEDGQIRRMAASTARLASVITRLPECRARVHVELILAFAQCWVGARTGAWLTIARAEKLAERLRDPIARTACFSFRHVLCGWQDDLVESERCALMCHESAQWMEQTEYVHLCIGMCGVETARGRPEQSWVWIERALGRVHYEGRAPAILGVLESAGCATLLTLGRAAQAHALKERLKHFDRAPLRPGSYLYLLQFQSRVQELVAREQLDQEFEAVIDEFEACVRNPRHGHIVVVAPFYIQVGHARLQQCLQAKGTAREALLPALERVNKTIELVTRKRAGAAHALLLKAACAWLRGSKKAAALLAESERLAQLHGYAWVSCTANRLRAHMLRADGNLEAAHDQARIAAMLAEQYGQTPLLRAIRQEFFAEMGSQRAR